jgi:hypothetical protein
VQVTRPIVSLARYRKVLRSTGFAGQPLPRTSVAPPTLSIPATRQIIVMEARRTVLPTQSFLTPPHAPMVCVKAALVCRPEERVDQVASEAQRVPEAQAEPGRRQDRRGRGDWQGWVVERGLQEVLGRFLSRTYGDLVRRTPEEPAPRWAETPVRAETRRLYLLRRSRRCSPKTTAVVDVPFRGSLAPRRGSGPRSSCSRSFVALVGAGRDNVSSFGVAGEIESNVSLGLATSGHGR